MATRYCAYRPRVYDLRQGFGCKYGPDCELLSVPGCGRDGMVDIPDLKSLGLCGKTNTDQGVAKKERISGPE